MLASTRNGLKRAAGYQNRVMVCAHRRQRARYLPPKTPYVRSPLANKSPEHYHETWDPHSGIEWYNRLRHRGAYRHWPWAKWTDDPIRFHEDQTCRRTFSALDDAPLSYGKESAALSDVDGCHGRKYPSPTPTVHSNAGAPLFDYYAEVGEAYHGISPSCPLEALAQIIHPYVRAVWTKEAVRRFLAAISHHPSLQTRIIADVQTKEQALVDWAAKGGKATFCEKDTDEEEARITQTPKDSISEENVAKKAEDHAASRVKATLRMRQKDVEYVPLQFVQHVIFASRDVVRYYQKRQYRQKQHNEHGVLRTREMERYYALPYPTLKLLPADSCTKGNEGNDVPPGEGTVGKQANTAAWTTVSPAMPVRLAQPSGKYPWGKYTYIGMGLEKEDKLHLDPLHSPDGWYKDNQYPG